MNKYYLAVDIGASSGRHILGHMEDDKMVLEEIFRFENGMKKVDGHRVWDTEALFQNILAGMKKCKAIGKIPCTMAIDTWAVDYALLDDKDQLVGKTYGYRDRRTEGMDEKVYSIIPEAELYQRTGIQKQIFNTIFQLMAVKEEEPGNMERAESLLMIPDYFNFLLTGVKKTEYTNASTTGLVIPASHDWDFDLIEKLGYKKSIFGPISMAGTEVGNLRKEIAEEVGFDLTVVQTTSHDTASAVLAVPALEKDFLYISSGTWSLMGTENDHAILTKEAMEANLTNEGGYQYRYRFLKNIMGLWIIQNVRHEVDDKYTFLEIQQQTEKVKDFPSRIPVNDQRFLAPDNMTEAIREYLKESGQKEFTTLGELGAVVYWSLAESYGESAKELEKVTGKTYDSIYIVGGGAYANILNQMTADASGKRVLAAPMEATAAGNLTVQMLRDGVFSSVEEARQCIHESFPIREFTSSK